MINYLSPLYAVGAITDKQIDCLEANLIKEEFGLNGDNSNQNILLIVSFYTKSTASVICANGLVLR